MCSKTKTMDHQYHETRSYHTHSAALIIQISLIQMKSELLFPQGSDRRVRNPEIPPARHARRPPAGSTSHPHQEIPSKRWHSHVVPHIHVGGHLPTVRKLNLCVCFINCIKIQTINHKQFDSLTCKSVETTF